jgi:anti-anti-sigma regulatory factor
MGERQRFTAEFKREAVRLLDAGVIKILLNFSGVTGSGYSSGLDDLVGDLAGAHITAANRGARLKLANLPPVIKGEPLAITQLITIFDVFDSEDEGGESSA